MVDKDKWKGEARDFVAFKNAIKEELNKKPAGSEWIVELQVKKSGNPIHEFAIELRPI